MNLPSLPGAKLAYYCVDGKTAQGPISIDEIVLEIIARRIPATVLLLPDGAQDWIHFEHLPDAWMSPGVLQQLKDFSENLDRAQSKKMAARGCGQVFVASLFLGSIIYFLFTFVGK